MESAVVTASETTAVVTESVRLAERTFDKPNFNVVTVTPKRKTGFYLYLTRRYLAHHFDEVELTATGTSISDVMQIAHSLKTDGLATPIRIKSEVAYDQKGTPVAKLRFKVKKSEGFDRANAELEAKFKARHEERIKQQAENERLAAEDTRKEESAAKASSKGTSDAT